MKRGHGRLWVLCVTTGLAACISPERIPDAGDSSMQPPARDAGGGPSLGAPPEPIYPDDSARSFEAGKTDPNDTDTPEDLRCFDGQDNDGNSEYDCQDLLCASLASCRVGDGDACYGSGAPIVTTFTSCGSIDVCEPLLGVTRFGAPGPWIAEGKVHPGGTPTAHGGLILTTDIDLRFERLEVTTTFVDGPCGVGCIETASVAVSAQSETELTGRAIVRPLVAATLSPSRKEIQLQVNGAVAGSATYDGDPGEWTLTLRPTGSVTLGPKGGAAVVEGSFVPASDLSLLFFGRSGNRSEPDPVGASIEEVSIARTACDIPTEWPFLQRLPVLDPALPGVEADATRSAPTLVLHEGRRVIGFEVGERIHFATQGSDPGAVIERTGTLDLFATDPELLLVGTGTEAAELALFFTDHSLGYPAIGRAKQGNHTAEELLLSLDFVEPSVVIDPAPHGFSALEMPSVVEVNSEFVMVARATEPTGEQRFVLFTSRDLESWARFAPVQLETILDRQDVAPRFDHDEIASPSLTVHNGAYQLYYAGRRGTRWAVGLLLSEGLVGWRDVGGRSGVLSAQSRTASDDPFGSLGFQAPDAVSVAGEIQLVLMAQSGIAPTLGIASRQTGRSE